MEPINIGGNVDTESKRQLAKLLMQAQANSAPATSGLGVLAKALQGAMAGRALKGANEAEATQKSQLVKALAGGDAEKEQGLGTLPFSALQSAYADSLTKKPDYSRYKIVDGAIVDLETMQPGYKAEAKPMSGIGRINYDIQKGMVPEDIGMAAMRKTSTHAPAASTVVNIADPYGLSKNGQKTAETQMLNNSGVLQQLSGIEGGFKPEYQQLGTKWDMAKTSAKEKIGFDVKPEDQAALADFTAYRAQVGQFFAEKMKTMSGVAVSPEEARRQEQYLPKAGTGMFDGDSPTELKSKVDYLVKSTKNATARLAYARANGLSLDPSVLSQQIPLENVPKLINDRGKQISQELSAQNPGASPEQVQAKTAEILANEFGLVAQ